MRAPGTAQDVAGSAPPSPASGGMVPTEGTLVRVWWQQDGRWHAGCVTQASEDSGEFLVDYKAEEDGEGWVSTSHQWEAASSIAPSEDSSGPAWHQLAPVGLAPTLARLESSVASEAVLANEAEQTVLPPPPPAKEVLEDLDPVADQAQIEERFTTLYDEALRLHGDALSDPEAKFAVLLSAVESGG